MSKITFSQQISELLTFKINALENLDYKEFLKKEEYFELALCLSYMTLSKEKIIEKDMKNKQRLDRLTKLVPTIDIDAVFSPTFCDLMPNIINAKENNNTWILDAIRDSIMHCAFEIDEERECLILNNTQHDRDLQAEIPFSWFIKYAKYDILSKKIADSYNVKGFYYNTYKKNREYLNTKKEIINNILYNVKITGNKFNIKNIETRIKELFEEYSNQDIDDSQIKLYKKQISKEKIKYNEHYLVSFYIAKEKIKETIEKEFPGTNIEIYINNRKSRLSNKLVKTLPKYYNNYDLLFEQLNHSVCPKSISLLNYIYNIIELLDQNPKKEDLTIYEEMNLIDSILKGNVKKYSSLSDIYTCHDNGINILRSICFNIHGLTTLVINHEDLYNDYYQNEKTSDYNINAYSTDKFIEYKEQERRLYLQTLDKEILLFSKQEQLDKCTDKKGIINLTTSIKNILLDKDKIEKQIENLATTLNYIQYTNENRRDINKQRQLYNKLDKYKNHFYCANSEEAKKKLKKIIRQILEEIQEEEAKYTYGVCDNMKEAITIIRNSLSHIGRIYVGKNRNQATKLILNDYDNKDKTSGFVIGQYKDLINVLNMPLHDPKHKTKTLTSR